MTFTSSPSSSQASSPLRTAPGPTSARDTNTAMQHAPLPFLLKMTRQYGDVVRLPLPSGPIYLINHPDGVRQVLQERAPNYGKDPHENGIFIRFVGQSILTTEGDTWLRLRHLEQPAFHRQQILGTSAAMEEPIQTFLEEWRAPAEQGQSIDMVSAMTTLVLRVLGRALFSLDLEEETQTIARALKVIGAYALALFYHPYMPYLGPLAPLNRRYAAMQRALDQVVLRMIQKRRTQPGTPKLRADLLSFFLQVQDADGKPAFTDAQIRNETLSLLIAGHENASSLLCWTWYLLATHPAAAERVADEVATQLQGRTPTLADLGKLPYLRMVLDESLRLYPPAWSFPRRAHAQDSIGGYAIPAGAAILLCPYTTHRHPAFWPDPETFDPERFSADAAERPRYAYFPFGGGQHQCMGATFAMMEAHLILASLAQRYRLDLMPDFAIRPEPLVTLRPQQLPMRLRPAR